MGGAPAGGAGPGREASALAWGSARSPVGALTVACTSAGVAQVRYRRRPAPAGSGPDPRLAAPGDRARAVLDQTLRELAEYFAGQRRDFAVPADLSAASPAQQRVLTVLRGSVGFGETITYGALAARAGLAGEAGAIPARVAGQIMGANPCPIIVPCHRVVAGDGLGGYSGGEGIEVKRWLLIFEGALPPTLDWDSAGLPAAFA